MDEDETVEDGQPSGLAVAGEAAEEAALAQDTPMAPAHAGATATPGIRLSAPAQQVLLHCTLPQLVLLGSAACSPHCMQPEEATPPHAALACVHCAL
jgi:hypothetical protein